MPKSTDADYLSYRGAATLCQKIENYWKARDYALVVAEPYVVPGFEGIWGVRSNLRAGLPPRVRQ